MLNYIVKVTEDLVAVVLMLVMLQSFMDRLFAIRGRRSQAFSLWFGLFISAIMAVAKNRTSKIATNQWNTYIFYVAILSTVLFLVAGLISLSIKREKLGLAELLTHLGAGVFTISMIFYEVPDVMAYPFLFDLGKEGWFSIRFLVRFLGWGLALLLVYILGLLLKRSIVALNSLGALTFSLYVSLIANGIRLFGLVLGKWLVHPRWLKWPRFSSREHPWAFPLARFVSNHTLLFILIIGCAALLIPVLLFFRSLKIREPYDNPAQRRKLLAKNRRRRRISLTFLLLMGVAVVNLTLVRAYNNRVVVLSEPEEYHLEGDCFYIPLENLEDGHLHRFEYTTQNDVDIRWIVIKKPNSTAYGVGLDACNVCGIAGYFERNGQVVCKRCDVVMNISTIGFPGGCNPIPLEYSVEGGNMVIQLSDLLEGEKEFK